MARRCFYFIEVELRPFDSAPDCKPTRVLRLPFAIQRSKLNYGKLIPLKCRLIREISAKTLDEAGAQQHRQRAASPPMQQKRDSTPDDMMEERVSTLETKLRMMLKSVGCHPPGAFVRTCLLSTAAQRYEFRVPIEHDWHSDIGELDEPETNFISTPKSVWYRIANRGSVVTRLQLDQEWYSLRM